MGSSLFRDVTQRTDVSKQHTSLIFYGKAVQDRQFVPKVVNYQFMLRNIREERRSNRRLFLVICEKHETPQPLP